MKTKVLFRIYRKTGEVIALFPEVPASYLGTLCMSYMHAGQHGAASIRQVHIATLPAKPDQYRDLYAELTRIGYELDVVERANRKMETTRRKMAQIW